MHNRERSVKINHEITEKFVNANKHERLPPVSVCIGKGVRYEYLLEVPSNSQAPKKHIASLAMYMSMLPQGSHINKGLATVVIAAGRGSLWMVRPCATAPLVLAFVAAFLQVL